MSSIPLSGSSASVRNILSLLASRDAQLVAGASGLERRVTWACRMRVRLPAFESVQGGELALLTLIQLRRLDETLPHLLNSLSKAGVAAIAVCAQSRAELGDEALTLADHLHVPLILLSPPAALEEIEREVITFVVNFRGEVERKASEISQHLMQLSAQGVGMQGLCDYLARHSGNWAVVQDAAQRVRFQASPPPREPLHLPAVLTDDYLRQHALARVVEPIAIRHEVVGYLSLIDNEGDFDYFERIILSQVVPILALEFARERERSEVESRYHVEALTDVLQGNYQHPGEMIARASLLGYNLATPQIVAIFEMTASRPESLNGHSAVSWGFHVREELRRAWPSCWLLHESHRIIALLPVSVLDEADDIYENEDTLYTRLERAHQRIQQSIPGGALVYSCGMGRVANTLQAIPRSLREAQQALEIGRRLFHEGSLHSFAHLGIYRLLFYLDDQRELYDFYQETLGPLLEHDTHNKSSLVETLEYFFRCNGNLSETARTMHLHRNSLLYRLDRITEILGRSLDDSELRLSLQIALKIRHLQKH